MDGWWPDLAKFENLEAERFELRQDPYTADGSSSEPVSTVSRPRTSDSIFGNADSAVAPSRPLIRIVYWQPGSVATR